MVSSYRIQNIDINVLPISIAVYEAKDDDFIFVDFNAHAEKSENISKESLIGKKVTEVFPGVKEFGLFDVFKRVHENRQNEKFELNFYKDEHHEGWKVNDVIANEDGTIMAIYQDVTKEVHKKQTLDSLGTLIDSSDNEYYTFDKETLQFNYCNQSAKKNLGYDFEEIQCLSPVDIKPKFSKKDFLDILEPLVSGSKKQVVFQTQHQRKDGSLYDVEARVQLATIHNKEQFIVIVMDISSRIEHEKKMKEHQNMMLAQSKMASMGEMLGNIAHQWRQPLTVISTIASGVKLSMDLNRLDDKECKENLTKIVDVTQHLSSTIDDFRDFYKPDKSKELFRLEEVYEKSMSIVSNSLYRLNVNIVTNFEDLSVYGYPNEAVQVVLNIMNNAKDAFALLEYERYLFIDIKKEDDYALLKIKDNAGGIDEKIIDSIFDPYFTTKHKSQGTGIGLYMSKQIITKHMHGEIIVSNESYEYNNLEHTGAQFLIKIPLSDTK